METPTELRQSTDSLVMHPNTPTGLWSLALGLECGYYDNSQASQNALLSCQTQLHSINKDWGRGLGVQKLLEGWSFPQGSGTVPMLCVCVCVW